MKSNPDEFYIGWQSEAPSRIAHYVRMCIIAIMVIVPLTGITIVLNQKAVSSSAFEYGVPTETEGVILTSPAPFLQILRGVDASGENIYQYILLVAPGKHGVQEMFKTYEASHGHALHGRKVMLKGYLIYHDGKTLMEVEEMSDINETGAIESTMNPASYGQGTVMGEITDPKCLFGVMKPGYGKPHRSCAARCIAGGIPPVLKTVSSNGYSNYYIIADNGNASSAHEILPFVGDQVIMCGQIRKLGDWLILYKDPEKKVRLLPVTPGMELAQCR